jgi:hypothetical protein
MISILAIIAMLFGLSGNPIAAYLCLAVCIIASAAAEGAGARPQGVWRPSSRDRRLLQEAWQKARPRPLTLDDERRGRRVLLAIAAGLAAAGLAFAVAISLAIHA